MILVAAADSNINCVEPADSYDAGNKLEVVTDSRISEDVAAEAYHEPKESEEAGQEGPSIPEDAENGETVNIFGPDEVPIVEPEKDKKSSAKNKQAKKPAKQKGPGFFSVQWEKVKDKLENMYNSASQENV